MEPAAPESGPPTPRGFALASLRHRLLLLVLLAVMPALALLLATTWEQRRQAAQGARDDALRIARLASSQHVGLVEGARALLVGLSQLSDVQMHNARACNAVFADVQRTFPLYKNVGAVRPDGHVFCAARPHPATNVAELDYFRQALTSERFSTSGYRMDAATGGPVLTLSYPAIDRAGAVWAVVFANLDLGWLPQLATRADLPAGSIVSIVDGTGLVLARYPDDGERVGTSAAGSSVIATIKRRGGEGTLDAKGLDGIERLYAYSPLGGVDGSQPLWVIVGIPRRAALAEADRLLTRNLVWAGAVILLMMVAAGVVSDLFILRRVNAVVRAARRLTAGDLSARAAVRGSDEIGVMAKTFNTMAERLQDRVKDEQHAKEQLSERVGELDLLNQLGEVLQSCFSLEEAYSAIGPITARLFPTEAGAVFALNRGGTTLEALTSWGQHPLDATAFAAESCWALRNHRTYAIADTASDALCQHLPADLPAAYLCVPLSAPGKALGVLYVSSRAGSAAAAHAAIEARHRLAEAVAAQLGLGLANVELREALRMQSIHDPLTGLFNRRYMEETLEREVHRARRAGRPMSVLMLDVDSFKQQNDLFGHDAGDSVLREIGRLLRDSLRKEDVPCRFGGEEFVLVLPDASLEGAARRAEQIRQAVSQMAIAHGTRMIGPVTVSIGVATFPEHGHDGRALLHAADAAMYQAKRDGRDRVSVAALHSSV
jgi:diguanylate cyclase (GGDEF)-like protein